MRNLNCHNCVGGTGARLEDVSSLVYCHKSLERQVNKRVYKNTLGKPTHLIVTYVIGFIVLSLGPIHNIIIMILTILCYFYFDVNRMNLNVTLLSCETDFQQHHHIVVHSVVLGTGH